MFRLNFNMGEFWGSVNGDNLDVLDDFIKRNGIDKGEILVNVDYYDGYGDTFAIVWNGKIHIMEGVFVEEDIMDFVRENAPPEKRNRIRERDRWSTGHKLLRQMYRGAKLITKKQHKRMRRRMGAVVIEEQLN